MSKVAVKTKGRGDLIYKFRGAVVCLLVVFSSVTSFARNKYLVDCANSGNYWYYYNSDGTSTSTSAINRDSDIDLEIVRTSSDNKAYSGTFDVHSFTIAGTNVTTSMTGPWCDGNGTMTIGEGGVTMAANNMIRFGSKSNIAQFLLDANQTWSGPAGGTAWSEFAIGCKESWNGYYWQSYAKGLANITWTLDGRIKLSFTATNDLSTVDLVVNPEARLVLVEKWSNQTFGGALRAKSLTLKGGDAGSDIPLLTIGAENPYLTTMGTTYAPSAFSDITLAPKVYLVDGASIKGGTVDYSVGELYVSGGASTFSGDVTITEDVAIDISGDASLEFSGGLHFADSTAIDLTGDGSLKFSGQYADLRITGDGTLEFAPVENEIVLSGDLSSFTGKIHVASGELLIHPDASINPSVAFTTAGGASYRTMNESDFGDYTVGNRKYYRDSYGVTHSYLSMSRISSNTGWPRSGQFYYLSDDGTTNWVNWTEGSVIDFELPWSAGLGSEKAMHTAGIVRREGSGATTPYIDGNDAVNGIFSIGERGIEFCRNSQGIYVWKSLNLFQLAESQTWKAPAAETFGSGHCRMHLGGSWRYIYPTGSMTATKDDITLTLEGHLLVSVYWPSNDFSSANIVVKSPALLQSTTPGGLDDDRKNIYGRINAKTVTFDGGVGMYFGSKTIASTGVGSAAVISPTNVARKIILKNGATLTSVGTTTWTGTGLEVAEGSSGGMSGTFVLQDASIPLTIGTGATLDMTGATLTEGPGVSAGFTATGSGTVRVSIDDLSNLAGVFVANGPVVEIADAGRWTGPLSGASGLTIASSGVVSVSDEALSGFGCDITVSSGTLVLDSVASIPVGRKVITSGSGKLVLIDMSGFDADTHMGGTQNIGSDGLIVTDTARENETLTLESGQTLHVFGSGLKASSTVKFLGGSSLVFHKTATVSAPVQFTNGVVTVSSALGAEGTFTGAVTQFSNATCEFYADGGLTFANGFTKKGGVFSQRRGRITFKDKYCGVSGDVRLFEGVMCITNCQLTLTSGTWSMDRTDQTGDVVLEIAKGGNWTLGNNGVPNIGGSNTYESRVVINGGKMSHSTYDSFRMDYNGSGKAVIELNGGQIETQRRIWSGHDMSSDEGYAKFIWRGGKIYTSVGYGYPYRFYHLFMGIVPGSGTLSQTSGVEFHIEGTNCVLDLNGFLYPNAFSNFTGNASRMIGKPGAVLSIKGRSGYANKMTLLGFEPNGMILDLNQTPSVDFEIVGEGDSVELGVMTPWAGGDTVSCIGTASPLLANYIVPAGGTFENADINNDWNSGFSVVTNNNLVFGEGVTYHVSTTPAGFSPLELNGSLVLPSSATLSIDKSAAPVPTGEGYTLISTKDGVDGDCTWTINGSSRRTSRVYADESALRFDYKPNAFIMTVR